MVDFHCHILPGVDDGSKSVEESLQMLHLEQQQGVDAVIQRFFLNRAHIRFLQCADIEADHIAWMLRKQGAEIVLRLRFI